MTDTKKLLALLRRHYPQAQMILKYTNNFELLVSVILSAQCTDLMVNKVTSTLFPKYRIVDQKAKSKYQKYKSKIKNFTPEAYEIINFAEVDRAELALDIKSTGFFNNKAKSVQEAARTVLDKFGGILPRSIAEMITIPGVARKTANVVLGNAYGIYEGLAVDTHVKKQAQRFGLTKNTDPVKIEKDLMKLFDQTDWFSLTYLLIEHGRTIRLKKDKRCILCPRECELEQMAIHPASK